MSYEIKKLESDFILELSYESDTNLEEQVQSRDELFTQAINTKIKKILVDLSKLNSDELSVEEMFEFSESWQINADILAMRFAVLLPELPPAQSEIYFTVSMLEQKGITMKPFEDRDKALAWLS